MRRINDCEWQAVEKRNRTATFLVAVTSTRIFCRAGCPARTPKRENLWIVENAEAALVAGFRPCLRCRPVGADPEVQEATRLARAIQAEPMATWSLREVAEVSGPSGRAAADRFRRVFGISPRTFRDAVRLDAFKLALKEGAGVTEAGYDAGYGGAAARHEATRGLGMTASSYAKGAEGEIIETVIVETPLGAMVLSATERGICFLSFDDSDDPMRRVRDEFPQAEHQPAQADGVTETFARDVVAFLEGKGPRPDLPVDLFGTAFQLKVWQALQEIPQGRTVTYGELAKQIGHPGAARAVGSANAKNRVAVLVPCHLVVAGGGKLGGYATGLDRKRKLLALEGV